MATQFATFGAGCFWSVEETFRQLPGVVSTAVGYMGGSMENPTYEDVCTDTTGHVEVVHIEYDPDKIPYANLLDVFWENHDPTTLNRQGPDIGTQYRSVVFFHTSGQQKETQKSKAMLEQSKKYDQPIVTEVIQAQPFYRAEEYHQKYLQKRGLSTCHI